MNFKKSFPNALTVSRFVGLVVATWFLFRQTAFDAYLAFALYVLVTFTDFFDGYLARRWGTTSPFGKLLDPIADKAYILTLYFSFALLDLISIWWVVPIAIREIGVTTFRLILAKKNLVIAAEKSGKIKAFMQNISLFFLFTLYLNIHYWTWLNSTGSAVLGFFAYGFLMIAVVLTITSGLDFIRNTLGLWKEQKLQSRNANER